MRVRDSDSLSEWRKNREPGWYKDIGYVLQDILRDHRYQDHIPSTKAGDPGWHSCTCGWEGYWSEFDGHVANYLRAAVADRMEDVLDVMRRPCV